MLIYQAKQEGREDVPKEAERRDGKNKGTETGEKRERRRGWENKEEVKKEEKG